MVEPETPAARSAVIKRDGGRAFDVLSGRCCQSTGQPSTPRERCDHRQGRGLNGS